MKKRIVFILVVLLATVLCCAAHAADYEYTLDKNGNAEITNYSGSAADVEIPLQIDGHSVTSIGLMAFNNAST